MQIQTKGLNVKDTIWMNIAWLLPRSLVYWCAIRVLVHATSGKYANQKKTLGAADILTRWRERK